MKHFAFIFAVGLMLAPPAFARDQSLFARITVYWARGGAGSDACTREHECATGARLRAGHCAVDPKKIPYGSKVIFPDASCVAVDTGRDVINRKAARRSGRTATERRALVIDRFFETKGQAMSWAAAHPHFMTVRVLSPNEQLEGSKSTKAIAKQETPPNVTGKSPRTVQQKAATLARNIAATEITIPPQNKLLADNAAHSSFLPSRF